MDVRVFGRVLTQDEITRSCAEPLTLPANGLLGYWPLSARNHGDLSQGKRDAKAIGNPDWPGVFRYPARG